MSESKFHVSLKMSLIVCLDFSRKRELLYTFFPKKSFLLSEKVVLLSGTESHTWSIVERIDYLHQLSNQPDKPRWKLSHRVTISGVTYNLILRINSQADLWVVGDPLFNSVTKRATFHCGILTGITESQLCLGNSRLKKSFFLMEALLRYYPVHLCYEFQRVVAHYAEFSK